MTATNGWPGKPGVPLNPEQDGWHWLLAPDGEQFPCLWSVIGVSQRGRFPMGWISDPESWSPQECTYLGPVLLPAEATALQARADRNAAGFARVDAEAERAKFLHKQEIAALQKRVAELEGLAYGLMLAMSASGHDFTDILREARAAVEGKKDE